MTRESLRALALSRLIDAGIPTDDADEMADLLQYEDERAVEIVALAKADHTSREIALRVGLSHTAVLKTIRRINARAVEKLGFQGCFLRVDR